MGSSWLLASDGASNELVCICIAPLRSGVLGRGLALSRYVFHLSLPCSQFGAGLLRLRDFGAAAAGEEADLRTWSAARVAHRGPRGDEMWLLRDLPRPAALMSCLGCCRALQR